MSRRSTAGCADREFSRSEAISFCEPGIVQAAVADCEAGGTGPPRSREVVGGTRRAHGTVMRRPPRPRAQRNDDLEHGDFFAVMVTISLVASLLTAASYWIW
jgi:hypothetical protein